MMNEDEMRHFIDTTAATTIAVKAVLTLYMAGIPISRENATQAYGKWINPNTPHFERLVLAVDAQVSEMMGTAEILAQEPRGSA
ncbi:MAG: hypothetical protein ACK4M8_02115 [Allorhizobium sp.]